jgi:hypothetical protein
VKISKNKNGSPLIIFETQAEADNHANTSYYNRAELISFCNEIKSKIDRFGIDRWWKSSIASTSPKSHIING